MCPRQLTAENYRNIYAAESRLAKLDFLIDLAELHDTEPCPRLRQSFAERYRKLIGVHPDLRERFRAGLERLRVTGMISVEELGLRLQSVKLFDSGPGGD